MKADGWQSQCNSELKWNGMQPKGLEWNVYGEECRSEREFATYLLFQCLLERDRPVSAPSRLQDCSQLPATLQTSPLRAAIPAQGELKYWKSYTESQGAILHCISYSPTIPREILEYFTAEHSNIRKVTHLLQCIGHSCSGVQPLCFGVKWMMLAFRNQ